MDGPRTRTTAYECVVFDHKDNIKMQRLNNQDTFILNI